MNSVRIWARNLASIFLRPVPGRLRRIASGMGTAYLLLIPLAHASHLECEVALNNSGSVLAKLIVRGVEQKIISTETVIALTRGHLTLPQIALPSATPDTLALQQALRLYLRPLPAEDTQALNNELKIWLEQHRFDLDQRDAAKAKTKEFVQVESHVTEEVSAGELSTKFTYRDIHGEHWAVLINHDSWEMHEWNIVTFEKRVRNLDDRIDKRRLFQVQHLVTKSGDLILAYWARRDLDYPQPMIMNVTKGWKAPIPALNESDLGAGRKTISVLLLKLIETPDGNIHGLIEIEPLNDFSSFSVFTVDSSNQPKVVIDRVQQQDRVKPELMIWKNQPAVGLRDYKESKWCIHRPQPAEPLCWNISRNSIAFRVFSDFNGDFFTTFMEDLRTFKIVGLKDGVQVEDALTDVEWFSESSLVDWQGGDVRVFVFVRDEDQRPQIDEWKPFGPIPAKTRRLHSIERGLSPSKQLIRDLSNRLWILMKSMDNGIELYSLDGQHAPIPIDASTLQELVVLYPISVTGPQTIDLASGVQFSFANLLWHLHTAGVLLPKPTEEWIDVNEVGTGLVHSTHSLGGARKPFSFVFTKFLRSVEGDSK